MADHNAIQRLLERLQTGWPPKADEIDPAVPQTDALNAVVTSNGITYQTIDRQPRKTGPVIYIDDNSTYALTAEVFFWLYREEESEKVRFLGG
jgi:hypothetical protein